MIRQLKKKFVFTAMVAITVLLVVLLGGLNIANGISAHTQLKQTARMLAQDIGGPGLPDKGLFGPGFAETSKDSAVYFRAELDDKGNVIHLETDRISSVTVQEAGELVQRVLKSDKDLGYADNFLYYLTESRESRGTVAVFLDTSLQVRQVLQVLVLSLALGIVCWLVMLLFVRLLASRAIAPIAANIEKQKQFVTDAGHEIKTPLAIILANTDAMELHQGESKWSKNIRAQTLRLNGLMQHLLTLSKAEETLAPEAGDLFDFSAMTLEMVQAFAEPVELAHLHMEQQIEPELTVRGNRELLQRLVSILLDNAVKYTPEEGMVQLQLDREDKKVRLVLRNTCHFESDFQPERLFDRFYRGDSARTQRSGGYGIGLSAARAIVEMHRGSITAQRVGEDMLQFTVKL